MAKKLPKLPPKGAATVEQMAAQIRLKGGNLADVARGLGLTRQAVSKFVREHAELKDVVAEAKECLLDEAEGSLRKAVRKCEGWAVCFFLKTQGKQRGYVERTETKDVSDDAVRAEIHRLLARLGDDPAAGA